MIPASPTRALVATLATPALFAFSAACDSGESPTGVGGAQGTTSSIHGSTSSAGGSGGGGGSGGARTTSSASVGGGGGGALGCAPGETKPCYPGPVGTEGVGPCKPGLASCNASGVGFGPCVGAVVPKPEVCGTPEDDDCNGSVNDGCVCEPYTEAPCYTGPTGTLGVGVCRSGYHVCQYTGKGYGSCIEEIVPTVENCASVADEDCNGSTPACTGAHVLSRGFGGALDEEGVSIATDASGNVILAAITAGAVDFGCGPIAGGGAPGGVIVKLGPTGSCLWSKRFGDGAIVTAVGTNLGGDVHVTGTMVGTVDFGGGPLVSAGQTDVFFAKLDPNGNLLWAKRFGGPGAEVATGLAVDEANTVTGIGTFQSSIDFGGGPMPSQGGSDFYLVRLNAAGAVDWAKTFGDVSDDGGGQIAVDIGYGVLVALPFSGAIDVGGGPLVSAGQRDVLVAKLDSSGEHVWSRSFGDAQDQEVTAIAVDRSLDIVIAGAFDGTMNLGTTSIVSAGGGDVFLISLDPDGGYRWSLRAGDASAQTGALLAVDPFGNVALGVAIQGVADFGGGPLASVGGVDVAIAKYDPSGNPLWSKRFGGAGTEAPRSMAFAPSGVLFMTGTLGEAVDFGAGAIAGAGGEDACLVGLAP